MNTGEGQPQGEAAGRRVRRWLAGHRVKRGLAGLALLAIVSAVALTGYQSLVTTAGQHARPVAVDAARLAADPGGVYDRVPVTPSPSPVPTPSPTPVPPPLEDSPIHIVIDRIGVDAPVVAEGVDADNVPVVPLNSYQVAWYTFSAQPGTGSNAVFAGHVTWGGPAVFYSLNQLAPGDSIKLVADTGSVLTYTVTDSYTVDVNDPGAGAVMGPTSGDVITVITCDGTRYYTGDPVFGHAYTDRRIIRAALTSESIVGAVEPAAGG
ncbi:MAG TPA: class F sortase [Dehalococcoidia bacterium]|nr:class F sortase [Dehalococcoidia bacterium]